MVWGMPGENAACSPDRGFAARYRLRCVSWGWEQRLGNSMWFSGKIPGCGPRGSPGSGVCLNGTATLRVVCSIHYIQFHLLAACGRLTSIRLRSLDTLSVKVTILWSKTTYFALPYGSKLAGTWPHWCARWKHQIHDVCLSLILCKFCQVTNSPKELFCQTCEPSWHETKGLGPNTVVVYVEPTLELLSWGRLFFVCTWHCVRYSW